MQQCYTACSSFCQKVAVDFSVNTETLTAVEPAEMETAGGNYSYCLGRNVAFERQFLMCKSVHSYALSENASLSWKRGWVKQHADGCIKQVTTVWDPIIKEQHKNPDQAVPLFVSMAMRSSLERRSLHIHNFLCCKPNLLQPCTYLFGRAIGQSWFHQVCFLSPLLQQNFVLKLNLDLSLVRWH